MCSSHVAHISKLSFQYGFRVFLITEVVLVCSPPMVATANGSGNPKNPVLVLGTAQLNTKSLTENIPLIKPISSDYYGMLTLIPISFAFEDHILVTRRFGALEEKYQLSNSKPSQKVTHDGRSESILCAQLNLGSRFRAA